jgi:ABC-2 type transport system permease protein
MFHILRFEFKQLLATRLFWWVSAILAVTIFFAVYNGKIAMTSKQNIIKDLKEEEAKRYDKFKSDFDSLNAGTKKAKLAWYQDPRTPLTVGMFRNSGKYAILAPAPLSFVATGQSDIEIFYSKVSYLSDILQANNVNFENPFNIATGQFDLAFVLVFLLPLLVIALTYNILSAEREQGTLPLLLSQPMQIRYWLSTKLAFRFGVLLFTIVTLLVLAFTVFDLDFIYIGFFQLLLAVVLYTLFWFALSLFINLLGKSSAMNTLLLSLTWLLFVFIIPSIANMVATSIYPVPSRVELVNAKRRVEQETERNKQAVLAKFYQAHPQLVQKSEKEQTDQDYYREYVTLHEVIDEQVANVQQVFDNQLEEQQAFAHQFQYFSPAVLMQNALNEIAQTDSKFYKTFQKNIVAYQQKWKDFFKPKFINDEKMTVESFAQIPVYEPIKKEDSSFAIQLVALALFSLVLCMLAFTRQNKYQNIVA